MYLQSGTRAVLILKTGILMTVFGDQGVYYLCVSPGARVRQGSQYLRVRFGGVILAFLCHHYTVIFGDFYS